MNLWLELKGTAGTDISEVFEDMETVSKRLGIPVEVNVNGILVLCVPGTTKEDVEANYYAVLNSRNKKSK